MLFQSQYRFHGTHADKVTKLTAEFSDKHKLFSYTHEIYQLAPIVGYLYQRKAAQNNENGKVENIFLEQISRYRDVFEFNYRLIMLLDKNHEPDFETRVDKAFRLYATEKAKPDEILYEEYVRGGVDVLYEKLIEQSTDYVKNLYEFMEDFESRHGQNVDEILDLCQIARS